MGREAIFSIDFSFQTGHYSAVSSRRVHYVRKDNEKTKPIIIINRDTIHQKNNPIYLFSHSGESRCGITLFAGRALTMHSFLRLSFLLLGFLVAGTNYAADAPQS